MAERTEKVKPSPAERALKREIQLYAARTAKRMIGGVLLTGTGIALMILGPSRYDQPRPDLWLYRTFGAGGAGVARWGFGIAILLLGVYQLYHAIRRMRVGQPALEARSRKLLGLPPS